jgi:hypothetical protein
MTGDPFARSRARQPKTCPVCGAPEPVPTWDAPDEWICSDHRCAAVWREGDG